MRNGLGPIYIELIIKVTSSKCCSAKTKRLTGHYKKRGRKKGADRRRTGAKRIYEVLRNKDKIKGPF